MKLNRLALAAIFAALAGAAQAHPMLKASTPERAGVVKASPKEIRVTFSEGVSAAVSSFTLTDAARKPYPIAADRSDPKDSKTLIVALPRPLPPGSYALRWMVGSDEHASVPGTLRFEVKP